MRKPSKAKDQKPPLVEAASTEAAEPAPSPVAPPEHCPVVGIGASAGGLEAFTQLLSHLPKRTGLAFALVQHLDPTRASQLPEILARSTGMEVVEVKSGIHLEPDRVYVIPPNTSMSLSDGTLTLAPRERGAARHLPIDHFFESLAAHRGNRAIGVVLSGNAFDGTRGLKAIKAAGGVAFAQDEASAKFPGMPRSAIGAGFVDFILPPEKIAEELARLGATPYFTAAADQGAPSAKGDELKKMFTLLHETTGVDFGGYRQTTIHRRIQRRLAVQRMDALEEYLKLLEKNPEEVQTLFRDILIHVTSFFREPETFAALKARVFPELLKQRHPDEPVRVWVPGCSTGEEAYSLAISLVEFLGDKSWSTELQIFGSDVSDQVIEFARRGIYPVGIESDVSPKQLKRFFTKVDQGYHISKSIRDLCVFARQNLVKDPPFSKLDLISCRNVMIYFEAPLQKKLMPVFHYALKPRGYLQLGSAETIGSSSNLFTALDAKNRIFVKRGEGNRSLPEMPLDGDIAVANSDSTAAPSHPPEVWSRLDIFKEADRMVTAKYCPPGLVVNDEMEIIQFRGEVAPFLNPGTTGEASLNLFKMTRPAFAAELRSAIAAARSGLAPPRNLRLHLEMHGVPREISLEVIRMDPPAVNERAYVILFEDPPSGAEPPMAAKGRGRSRSRDTELAGKLAAAEANLESLVEEHQATTEELRSANEEIQSSNEELQSTNEQLEIARQELQSTNEELTTLNGELRHHNATLTGLNDDMNNLLRGVSLPVVMLGRDLSIRRFTPAAQKYFKMIAADIGRTIMDIKADIDVPDLEVLVREVIESLSVKERELRDRQGCWHRLQIRPYETGDNKIAGAVLILFDIDEAKRSARRLEHTANYAEAIIKTVREPLLVLDGSHRVKHATEAFCTQFRVSADATEGQLLYDLGDREWDIPALRSLLEDVLPKNTQVYDFKVEHTFRRIGKKTMLLNARRVESADGEEALLLLSITEAPK